MNFDNIILEYMRGINFSSGLQVKISETERSIPERITILEQLISEKKIIHLGCADHIPNIPNKILTNTWLHARLCEKASRCLGVDINKEAVDFVINKLGYTDVICSDIIQEDIPEITETKWDYLVVGEVLEHFNNPGLFLSEIKTKYSGIIDRMILSVPNAFSYQNFEFVYNHQEVINSDHRYWFTPYTLGKLVILNNMEIENFLFCEYSSNNQGIRSWYKNYLLKNYPAFRQVLIIIIKI